MPPPIIARASTTQTTVIVIFRLRLLLSIKNCLNVLFSFFSIKQLTFNSIRHIVSLFASKSYTNPTNLLFLYFWLFTQSVQNIKRTDLRFYCTAAENFFGGWYRRRKSPIDITLSIHRTDWQIGICRRIYLGAPVVEQARREPRLRGYFASLKVISKNE